MKTPPAWVNKTLFPFESKWITIDNHSIHYVDEGTGNIIIFVHGTPEWSFGFRNLILALRPNFRCIAIDHLGFGLSDKPANANYSVAAHCTRLTRIIEQLGLRNITIVANDFGGGISMGYALRNVSNIHSVVLFNTWLWSLKNDSHFSKPAAIINSWLGRFLYKQLNAPVNLIMPQAFGDRKKLTPESHRHYKQAFPNAPSRVALYAIGQELMNASDWWQLQWDQLSLIEEKPFLILWGLSDKFLPPAFLSRWKQRLPNAHIIEYPGAGHFVQEERPEEMIRELRSFLQ